MKANPITAEHYSCNASGIAERRNSTPTRAAFSATNPNTANLALKAYTGFIDHLWEGKYSLWGADGKRIRRNVYAKIREEYEETMRKDDRGGQEGDCIWHI